MFLIGIPGLAAALLTLLPRLNAVVSDPADQSDPFSSSITIANTGYVPLDSVSASLGLGRIATKDSPPANKDFKPIYEPQVKRGAWSAHHLGLDDKFTIALNDVWSVDNTLLMDADIAVVVHYEIPLIHWQKEKVFPMIAHRQTNGRFYWYAKTVD
jgi:hypothetical protein